MNTLTVKCNKCRNGNIDDTVGDYLLGIISASIYLWAKNDKCKYCNGCGYFKFVFRQPHDDYDRKKRINTKLQELYKNPVNNLSVYYMD